MPALVWATAAVLCAWKSRERAGLALLAGVALAIAVLVRPTNLLALLPMGLAMGPSLRRWLLLILGGLPGAIFQCSFNWAVYGRIFTTGYGSCRRIQPRRGTPDTHPLCRLAAGAADSCHRAGVGPAGAGAPPPRPICLLAVWGLLFAVFYLFYSHTHEIGGTCVFCSRLSLR